MADSVHCKRRWDPQSVTVAEEGMSGSVLSLRTSKIKALTEEEILILDAAISVL